VINNEGKGKYPPDLFGQLGWPMCIDGWLFA
jgi:hypothetical protein